MPTAQQSHLMLAPRPTKLRSQRDINLWRIPLQLSLAAVALFGITLIPDILDKCSVIHIPSWLTMGSIDDARAILTDTTPRAFWPTSPAARGTNTRAHTCL